jgi:hypothetical protein
MLQAIKKGPDAVGDMGSFGLFTATTGATTVPAE